MILGYGMARLGFWKEVLHLANPRAHVAANIEQEPSDLGIFWI